MSNQDKYESRIRKAALLDGLENGLRDGGKCLICQCWKKPCANCNAAARNGKAAHNGKSREYLRAAAVLRVGP